MSNYKATTYTYTELQVIVSNTLDLIGISLNDVMARRAEDVIKHVFETRAVTPTRLPNNGEIILVRDGPHESWQEREFIAIRSDQQCWCSAADGSWTAYPWKEWQLINP